MCEEEVRALATLSLHICFKLTQIQISEPLDAAIFWAMKFKDKQSRERCIAIARMLKDCGGKEGPDADHPGMQGFLKIRRKAYQAAYQSLHS